MVPLEPSTAPAVSAVSSQDGDGKTDLSHRHLLIAPKERRRILKQRLDFLL